MDTKHTPGPWQIDPHKDGDYFWISPAASRGYGWVGDRYMRASGHMDISDALLIAAAPDMLQALLVAQESVGDLKSLEIVRAAIAKATGSAA